MTRILCRRYFGSMPSQLIQRTMFAFVLLTACGDDGDSFTTINWNITNVTNFSTDGGGEDEGATGDDGSTSDEPIETTSGSTGEAVTASTGEPTTGGPEEFSLPFPPTGCARIIEILGRATEEDRHVIVDANGCKRSSTMDLEFNVFGAPGPFTVSLGGPNGCRIYGGPSSAMTIDGGSLVTILGVDNPPAYEATLFVDGVPSDVFSAPAMLEGNPEWPGFPASPTTPVRRRYDWSFVDVPKHVGGCGLL